MTTRPRRVGRGRRLVVGLGVGLVLAALGVAWGALLWALGG